MDDATENQSGHNMMTSVNGDMDTESSSSETYDDTRQRRELRRKYRLKKTQIEANRKALEGNPQQLVNELEEIEDMFKGVKTTREAVLDCSLMSLVANIGKEQIHNLSLNTVSFNPAEYAEKLVTKMMGRRMSGNSVTPEAWAAFGTEASRCINQTPKFDFMLGTFERGETVYKERRRASQREKETQEPIVLPKEISQSSELKQEETSTEVERILGILHLLYERNNSDPIDFFEFVTNPDSFGLTVENVFHVSFLVKNGTARVYLDDDKLPVIEPTSTSTGTQAGTSEQNANQVILRMTIPDWEEIVKAFKIETPLIPPRRQPKTPT